MRTTAKSPYISTELECRNIQFQISALMVEPDIDNLDLPSEWIKTGEDFQDSLEDNDLSEDLSFLANESDPEWDDELDGIIYIDAKFGWKWPTKLEDNWDAGQRLLGWIRRPENRESVLGVIVSNST